jgi:hypothetical protein
MVNYIAKQKYIDRNLSLFTFCTKADKPAKTVMRHLPGNPFSEKSL